MHIFMFRYSQYPESTCSSFMTIGYFSSRLYRLECPCPWVFTKLMNVIATHLLLRAVSFFPYPDDWLIRDLIRNRLISHTKFTLQMVQNLRFIPNLKKSDLIPAQQFRFIGMEFLTQQKIVRVLAKRVEDLILTIKIILSQTPVSARTFLSLSGKLGAAADLILLGRLHL